MSKKGGSPFFPQSSLLLSKNSFGSFKQICMYTSWIADLEELRKSSNSAPFECFSQRGFQSNPPNVCSTFSFAGTEVEDFFCTMNGIIVDILV